MTTPPFRIHGLGELAIRCRNMSAMVAFYRDTLGLEVLNDKDFEDIVFFRIAEGVAGHTTVLALFQSERSDDTAQPVETQHDSLHHFALSLPWAEQERAIAWLADNGVPFKIRDFPWIGWRGVFIRDPENNHVELVAGVPPSST